MAEKNDFTENKPKENRDQALICIMNIIIDIVRLQQKLRFQEREEELLRTNDVVRFLAVIICKDLDIVNTIVDFPTTNLSKNKSRTVT